MKPDAIFSFAALFKKCAKFVHRFAWELGCLNVVDNYIIQQKFRPMPMKYKGVSTLINYVWLEGYVGHDLFEGYV